MTRPERISKMMGARNTRSGVRVKNTRVKNKRVPMSPKQLLLIISILFIIMGSSISHVWSNFEMTQKGYDISELKNEEIKKMDQNRKLRLELAILKSPQNLETQAKKLGLRQPFPEQIIVLR